MTERKELNPKELNKVRFLMNTHPLGGGAPPNVEEYYPQKRWLSLKDVAIRAVLLNNFLKIGVKPNTVEYWMADFRRACERMIDSPFTHDTVVGIFVIRKDRQFKNCFRVLADIGTLMDGGLFE